MSGFGKLYGGTADQPAYVTAEGERVWMWRKGQKVRFLDEAGEQVGPEHRNVVPAIIWAGAHAWVDPTDPILSLAVTTEVRANSHEVAR